MSFLILLIFLFWTTPRRHSFYSRIYIVSVHSPFSEKTFFNKHTSRKGSNCRFIFALFFHQVSRLSRHRFSHRLFIDFWWEMATKINPNHKDAGSLLGILFVFLSEGRSRLPAAIVPPPGLGKIVCMRKFARNLIPGSMQEYFFANLWLKRWISPKTTQNETPESAK